MAYEMLVGLKVINSEVYSQYRAAMKPILESFDGGFGCDFEVSKVLTQELSAGINRVFTIYFKDQQTMEHFFAHPEYKKVKQTYFTESVAETHIIASYQK